MVNSHYLAPPKLHIHTGVPSDIKSAADSFNTND